MSESKLLLGDVMVQQGFQAILATDLDGTLLSSDSTCSAKNLETLHELGRRSVLRVVATGRNLYSVVKTLGADFPIDVLVFSSGAGIWDWKTGTLLKDVVMEHSLAVEVADILRSNHFSFMAHAPIPDNHRFWFFETADCLPDFSKRCEMHQDLASRWDGSFPERGVTQFIVMARTEIADKSLAEIRRLLPELSVVRATSPWNPAYTWLEIFPKGISKGYALNWLERKLGLSDRPSLAIGNDYNDIELLDWGKSSRVVANAPKELLDKYQIAPGHNQDGVAHAVTMWLGANSSLRERSLESVLE